MIDPTCERLIRLADVPALPWLPPRRGGAKLDPSTAHRWATGGCRNVVLETLSIGGVRCTTEAALMRFFERLSTPGATSTTTTTTERRKSQERANAILDAAGIR